MDSNDKAVSIQAPHNEDTPMQNAAAQAEDANPRKRPRPDDGEESVDENTEANENGGTAQDGTTDHADPDQPKISKNQMRKLKRHKLWEERKEERKQLRKDKRHEKTARRRLEREEKAEELAQSLGIHKAEALKKILEEEQSKTSTQKSIPVPVAFVIDCDFEKYMLDNELVSLSSQITRSYAMNRSGLYQAHILVSSWGGKLKERFDTVLKRTHQNWKDVSFVEGDFVEAGKIAWKIMNGPRDGKTCPALGEKQEKREQSTGEAPVSVEIKDQLADEGQESTEQTTADNNNMAAAEFSTDSVIYLSADSPHVLDKLEPNTSYVIGGLVDRNREKNLCQRRAEEKGIRTAKLPIGEFLQMASRRVLATNHVVEIMSKWLETGDWGKAFMEVIPKRKGGQLKSEEHKGDEKGKGDEAADSDGQDNNGDGQANQATDIGS